MEVTERRQTQLTRTAGLNASQMGSWRVIGNSGSKGAHTILFANDLVLFMERPNWGIRAEPNPYLTVRRQGTVMSSAVNTGNTQLSNSTCFACFNTFC